MNTDELVHLLRRTEYVAKPDRVAALSGMTRAQAVDDILSVGASPAVPDYLLTDVSGQEYQQFVFATQWWLDRMVDGTRPMQERMTMSNMAAELGAQAGLIAGCALVGLPARVIGISADDPAAALSAVIGHLVREAAARLGATPDAAGAGQPIEVDDTFVGGGYGVPTEASIEATALAARTEGIVLDPVYSAKAMAGLIARIRAGAFRPEDTVVFWHTGGVPGYFAN